MGGNMVCPSYWVLFTTYLTLVQHRRRGIEARQKLVKPVGAWYTQNGRLHHVYHLWQHQYVHL
jgi:hypothetical protein